MIQDATWNTARAVWAQTHQPLTWAELEDYERQWVRALVVAATTEPPPESTADIERVLGECAPPRVPHRLDIPALTEFDGVFVRTAVRVYDKEINP